MISTYQRLKRRKDAGEIDGFTLIELLIVIVVLGILAAVVIFALGGITGKSQVAACQADGATLSTAISAFHAQNPNVTPTKLLLTAVTAVTKKTGGPYIQSWPNATSYSYALVTAVGSTNASLTVSTVGITPPVGPLTYKGPATCGTGAGNLGL
ncbi:MAG: type II secretion system protein [Acidimicrobiales bacterium]